MNNDPIVEQHSFGKSLFLHLFPGILTGLCYMLILEPFHRLGFPSIFSLMVSAAIILVPFELGYLLFLGKKRNGKLSLKGIVAYRNPISIWQYLIWVPILFVLVGIIFTVMKPIDAFIQNTLFAFIPPLESGLDGGFSKNVLVITYLMVAIFGSILGPVVEELYFRGYLLPRMKYAGKFVPLLHSFLFALYHFFTPWMIITRTLGMLPLVFAVKRRNIYVSIIVHVLVNLIDVIIGVSFIIGMTQMG